MKKILLTLIAAALLLITMGNSAIAQCTCPAGCSSLIDIIVPFSFDGAGEYCFRTTCLGIYINSWNLLALQINGVDEMIGYLSPGVYPPPMEDGYYYIYYKSLYAWGHLEIGGTCSGTTTEPTTDPSETLIPSPEPTESPTTAPDVTGAPTDTAAPTGTRDATAPPTASPYTTETPTAAHTTVPTEPAGTATPLTAYYTYANGVCVIEPETKADSTYTYTGSLSIESSIPGFTGDGYVRTTTTTAYLTTTVNFPPNMVVAGRFYDTATSSWVFREIFTSTVSGYLIANFDFTYADTILDRIIIYTSGTADSVWQNLSLVPITTGNYLTDMIYIITVN